MRHRPVCRQRELQVVDASAMPDVGLIACAAYLKKTPHDAQNDVVLLGTQDQHEHAASLGLKADLYCPPAANPLLAWHTLRNYISRGQYDCIRPWSQSLVACCKIAAANRARVVPVPGSTHTTGAAFLDMPETRLDIGTCFGDTRQAVRQRFGISETQPMVALLADPWWHADARRFVYMIGMLDIVEQPIAGLIDCRSAHLIRAQQFHSEAAVRWNMLVSQDPLCTVLHACDLAVIVPPEPHRSLTPSQHTWVYWSILRSHLLGVPVVGAEYWFENPVCPADIRDTLSAGRGAVTEIARTLAKIAHDDTMRMEIASRVREYAQNSIDPHPGQGQESVHRKPCVADKPMKFLNNQ